MCTTGNQPSSPCWAATSRTVTRRAVLPSQSPSTCMHAPDAERRVALLPTMLRCPQLSHRPGKQTTSTPHPTQPLPPPPPPHPPHPVGNFKGCAWLAHVTECRRYQRRQTTRTHLISWTLTSPPTTPPTTPSIMSLAQRIPEVLKDFRVGRVSRSFACSQLTSYRRSA